jgi:shikimate dehydrogenase
MTEYGLIGERLEHSYSKTIHELLLPNYNYELLPLSPKKFAEFMKAREFKGINVTFPYKKDILDYIDGFNEDVITAGDAINTLAWKFNEAVGEKMLIGYNTDYYGFLYTLHKREIPVRGAKVIIFGAGGAAGAIAGALRTEKAGEIVHVTRHADDTKGIITLETAKKLHSDADILINATPMGMYPNVHEKAFDVRAFPNAKTVIDIVYNPLRTDVLLDAKERGLQAIDGLLMLVAQAAFAVNIFFGLELPYAKIDEVYEKMLFDKQNIALIGMPASGKSTIAKMLAEKTGKRLVSIDELIEEQAGKSIADIFADDGENAFRAFESKILRKTAIETGLVIDCGGGIVKNQQNVRELKRNSVLLHIDRAPELLVSKDGKRPLLKSSEDAQKLYAERHELYVSAADATVENNGDDFSVAAECTLREFECKL